MRGEPRQPVFPFFVGCDRSGTTLIQAVFNSHPDLAIPYESHFIVPLLRRRARYERDGGLDLDGFFADLFSFPFLARWDLDQDPVRACVARAAPSDTPGAIRAVFEAYAEKEGKPNYGDKTPQYVRHLRMLSEAFPSARFVHIVRDGRDVALSLIEMEWGPRTIVEAARFWRQRVDAGRAAEAALGPARYTELRYEDFVADPERTTRSTCEFLGLEFRHEMLDYTSSAEKVLSQTAVPHRHQGLLAAPTKGRRDWRTQMERSDVALFEVIAGESLERFGYERGVARPSLAAHTSARTQQLVRKAKGIPNRVRWILGPRLKRVSHPVMDEDD